MISPVKTATLEDLYLEPGKAELIGGRIIRYTSTGEQPNRITGRIFRSLAEFVEALGRGDAFTDNIGYAVKALESGRESFSPDASYFNGPQRKSMRFIDGPPTLAVEVRSENDYTPGAEIEMAAKRADYFVAGTLVVWDVDTKAECIYCYERGVATPRVFRKGQQADAEPALPGWRVDVSWIFK